MPKFYFQKKLHTLTMESERLKSEITSRNDLLTRIDGETEVVEAVSILLQFIYLTLFILDTSKQVLSGIQFGVGHRT